MSSSTQCNVHVHSWSANTSCQMSQENLSFDSSAKYYLATIMLVIQYESGGGVLIYAFWTYKDDSSKKLSDGPGLSYSASQE